MKKRTVVPLLAIVALALPAAIPAVAQAGPLPKDPPTLTSVTQNSRILSANWALGYGTYATELDVSLSPTLDLDGFFPIGNIYAYVLLDPFDTSFTATQPLPAGNYYVQVQSTDYVYDYASNVVPITLADPPPQPPTPIVQPTPPPTTQQATPKPKKCKKGYKRVGNKCKKKKRKRKRRSHSSAASTASHTGAIRLTANP